MFLRRAEPGQTFVIPGSLRRILDGSAVTEGAGLTLVRDGEVGPAGGELAHVEDGCYRYTPTAAETGCSILGFILRGPGALPACGSIRVEYPVEIGSVAGVPVAPADGPLDANVTRWGGAEIADDADIPKTVTVEADRPDPGPPAGLPEFPEHFGRLKINEAGEVRLQPGQVPTPPGADAPPDFPPRFAKLAIDDDGRVKVQPLSVDFGLTARAE